MNKKPRRRKLGDVYAIPLLNGKYGFGRIFHDASIAVYTHTGTSIQDLPPTEDYQFIVGVYNSTLKSRNWEVVDNRPFNNEEDKWPPPACILDCISGEYSIYHKGEIRPSSETDCIGLETAAVWEAEHIVDRIMGDDKWHK